MLIAVHARVSIALSFMRLTQLREIVAIMVIACRPFAKYYGTKTVSCYSKTYLSAVLTKATINPSEALSFPKSRKRELFAALACASLLQNHAFIGFLLSRKIPQN